MYSQNTLNQRCSLEDIETDYHFLLKQERRSLFRGLQIIDYGTGRKGLARVILQRYLKESDQLQLFDPHARIHPPAITDSNIKITSLDTLEYDNIDLVSLSFVLCCLQLDECRELLLHIKSKFPRAKLFVLDYILKDRSELEAIQVLQHDTHNDESDGVLNQHFCELHKKFNLIGLTDTLENTGWQPFHISDYDTKAFIASSRQKS